MMHCIILLPSINFSIFLDEVGSIQLAAVSGLFVSLKHQNNSCFPRQIPPVTWQSIDLFICLFSGVGRSLCWGGGGGVDNVVDVI